MDSISSMICPSISERQRKVLECNKICTLMDFLMNYETIMSEGILTQLEYELAEAEIKKFLLPHFTTLEQLHSSGKAKFFLSTGIAKLDKMLDGGFKRGEIIEVFGKSGCGKSLFCMWLAAQISTQPASSVLYIQTKHDVKANTILKMCDEKKSNALQSVQVAYCNSLNRLLGMLEGVSSEHVYQQSQYSDGLNLIIIDAVPSLVYTAVTKDFSSWRFELERLRLDLMSLTVRQDLVIVVVNHAVNTYDAPFRSKRHSKITGVKPAMGKNWQHVPNIRILISNTRHDQYDFSVKKSNRFETPRTQSIMIKSKNNKLCFV